MLAALAHATVANPQLNAERARQRADDELVPQALSGFRPRIGAISSGGIEVTRTKPSRDDRRQAIQDAFDNADPDNPASVNQGLALAKRKVKPRVAVNRSLDGGLSIEQTLFDGGRTRANVGGAESAVLSGRETLRAMEQSALLAATTAYMDVVRARASLDVQRKNLAFLRATLATTRKRLDLGDISPTDLAQAQARFRRGEAALIAAEADLVSARAAYRQAIGAEPTEPMAGTSVEPLLPRRLSDAIFAGLRDHPTVRAAAHEVDAAQYAVSLAASGLYPTVTATGGANPAFVSSTDPLTATVPTLTSSAGLKAAIPIYDGGQASAQLRQAKETVGQRRHDLDVARDAVRAAVNTAWALLEAARAAIEASRQAVSANELALAGVEREQLEGQRTTLEVLNAQQELLNARLGLIGAERDRVVNAFALLGTVGGLSARRLGLAAPRYDARVHFDQVRGLWSGVRTPGGR